MQAQLFRSALSALCLVVPIAAQSAGFQDFAFPNATGGGSATIPSLVYYPATSPGAGAPLAPAPADGFPVVVFLHGQGRPGSDYTLVGEQLASNGYVAVLPNTGRFAAAVLRADGRALVSVLQSISATAGHFLEGALDMTRAGLAGHSMGGNGTLTLLSEQLGYDAGVCFAPLFPGGATTSQIDVPLGVIHGKGDTVLGWQNHGLRTFDTATSFTGAKFLYLFGAACNHDNLAGLWSSAAGEEVWLRSARVLTGFFDRYLKGEVSGLGEVVGLSARSEARLCDLYVEVEQPEVWTVGTPTIGQPVRVELMAEPGPAGVMTAAATAAVPTRFGELRLDPLTLTTPLRGVPDADRLATWDVMIPGSFTPGEVVPLQGFGLDRSGHLRLTSLHALVLE